MFLQVWTEPADWFCRYYANKPDMAKVWQTKKCGYPEKNVKHPKTQSALNHVIMIYPCKFGKNLLASSQSAMETIKCHDTTIKWELHMHNPTPPSKKKRYVHSNLGWRTLLDHLNCNGLLFL